MAVSRVKVQGVDKMYNTNLRVNTNATNTREVISIETMQIH